MGTNLWVFDGASVPFYTLPYSTRMTVIRLKNDQLWIHSPIELTDTLQQQIENLGEVTYLMAPNKLHHLYLQDWLTQFPKARAFGTYEVIAKRKDIDFAHALDHSRLWPWTPEIEYVLFTGSPVMVEAVFFHKATKTLLVTDLIENFPAHRFSCMKRTIARLSGILAPNGKTPIDWRLSFMFGKKTAKAHLAKIRAWHPQTIIMSHGNIVTDHAAEFLEKSFNWLS